MSLLIKPKNSLVKDIKFAEIKVKIIAILNEKLLPLDSYKTNAEYLVYVVNLIELHIKKKYSISKLDLLVSIFQEIFPSISTDEVDLIKKNVEFLHTNGHIIKLGNLKILGAKFLEYILKKL
jgi:hypothetical protein